MIYSGEMFFESFSNFLAISKQFIRRELKNFNLTNSIPHYFSNRLLI